MSSISRWPVAATVLAYATSSPVASAKTVVIKSIGPSATSYPRGMVVPAMGRIVLVTRDLITLLDERGTRSFRGPISLSFPLAQDRYKVRPLFDRFYQALKPYELLSSSKPNPESRSFRLAKPKARPTPEVGAPATRPRIAASRRPAPVTPTPVPAPARQQPDSPNPAVTRQGGKSGIDALQSGQAAADIWVTDVGMSASALKCEVFNECIEGPTSAENLWVIDPAEPGNFCLPNAAAAILFDRTRSGKGLTIWPAGNAAQRVPVLPTDDKGLVWPVDRVPIKSGDSYFIEAGFGDPSRLRLIVLDAPTVVGQDPADIAVRLAKNGCANQLERMAANAPVADAE